MTIGSIASPLTLETVQAAVARAIAHAPQERSRITRALPLILLGHCEQVSHLEFLVRSQTTDGLVYSVTPNDCECEAVRRDPAKWCSHQWAARIILAATYSQQRAEEERREQRVAADRVMRAYGRAS